MAVFRNLKIVQDKNKVEGGSSIEVKFTSWETHMKKVLISLFNFAINTVITISIFLLYLSIILAWCRQCMHTYTILQAEIKYFGLFPTKSRAVYFLACFCC